MKETAVNHYKSRNGNCAQSVALAWRDKKDAASQHAGAFVKCGGGQAPEGLCGALHAACELAGDEHRELLTERFKDTAKGYIKCREIRGNKIMPCVDCVATAARLLEELTGESK